MPCRCRPLARPGVARPAHTPRPATLSPVAPETPHDAPERPPVPMPVPSPADEENAR